MDRVRKSGHLAACQILKILRSVLGGLFIRLGLGKVLPPIKEREPSGLKPSPGRTRAHLGFFLTAMPRGWPSGQCPKL